MIQPTSKRPFGHPVPAAAIEYFCHPRVGHLLSQPAWGREGALYVANGWVALRFFGFPASFGTGPMEIVDRLRKQAWHNSQHEDKAAWRKLDDVTLDIFKEGLIEPWHAERLAYRADPCVRINFGALVPAVSLQMISRLPRCEIYTALDREQPVPFRFNGGEGLLARLTPSAEAASTPPIAHIFPQKQQH